MSENPNEPFDELMRRSLHEEADRIEPSDALPEIRARAHAQRPAARRPWLLTAGLAAAGTAAAIGAFTMLNGPENTADDGDAVAGSGTTTTATGVLPSPTPSALTASPSPEPSQAPTQPPSTSPSAKTTEPTDRGVPEPAVKSTVVPVYWLGQQVGTQKKAARLYRTWAKVSGRPAEQAVRIMTTKQPTDPDYYSVWRGAALNTVTRSNGIVTVDFKQLPDDRPRRRPRTRSRPSNSSTPSKAHWETTAPRSRSPRQGRSGRRLFGQVDTSKPLSRAQAADVQALVWIDSPAEDQVVKPKVTVQGVASAFEATVNYEATNLKTRETKKNFTTAKEGQKFSPYSFQLTLTPGSGRSVCTCSRPRTAASRTRTASLSW